MLPGSDVGKSKGDEKRMEDLISVIVPVYNVAKYLPQCINSIVAQTYSKIEIILVDDGSADGSGGICNDYRIIDSRITVIHQENAGLSAARNAGLDIARGSYFVFVDSDDWIEPAMIEVLYHELKFYQSDLALCDFGKLSDRGTVYNEYPQLKRECITREKMLECVVKYDVRYIVAWNKLYKRELFAYLRYPAGKIHEDEFLIHQLIWKCRKISIIPDKLYNYRVRENSIMQSGMSVGRLDGFEALYHRYQFFQSKGIENLLPDLVRSISRSYAFYAGEFVAESEAENNRWRETEAMAKEIFQEMIKECDRKTHIAFRYPRVWHKLLKAKDLAGRWKARLSRLKVWFIIWLRQAGKKYLLLNTPDHGNLGDQAIAIAERQYLNQCLSVTGIAECPDGALQALLDTAQYRTFFPKFLPWDSTKIIFYTGGGFLGNLWPTEEYRFRRLLQCCQTQTVIVFPATIYFDMSTTVGRAFFRESKEIYSAHPSLMIFCREKNTYEFMKNNMPKVHVALVPDMVTILNVPDFKEERSGILFCFRKDIESRTDAQSRDRIQSMLSRILPDESIRETTTVMDKMVRGTDRERYVMEKLEEFAASKLIVTDRLHAMVFAAITGTPCIAFDNSSKKVGAIYEWIKNNEYIRFIKKEDDFEVILKELDCERRYHYNREGLQEAFRPLRETVIRLEGIVGHE